MELFNRVKGLAENRKMSLNELEEAVGFSRNTLYKWKKQTPNGEKLKVIADFFDVSVDYLLGRTTKESSSNELSSTDLDKILDGMMSFDGEPMTDNDREAIRAYLQGRFSNK